MVEIAVEDICDQNQPPVIESLDHRTAKMDV